MEAAFTYRIITDQLGYLKINLIMMHIGTHAIHAIVLIYNIDILYTVD